MSNRKLLSRYRNKFLIIMAYLLACLMILFFITLTIIWQKLPDLNEMIDYKPPMPLRIYSSDNVLIGEFGEERRKVLRFDEISDQIKLAILAAEDDRFYNHKGINWYGMIRASLTNLRKLSKIQGASTITMQVARNFYLSSEKTYSRKIYELLLTLKIESKLTKNQILELYMNQIYLGHHTYGFEAASLTYLDKSLSEINIAEAALLAGIPKAPSLYNPVSNIKRAQIRKKHILDRMLSLQYISEHEHKEALEQNIIIRDLSLIMRKPHSEYVTETVRKLLFDVLKEQIYSEGLNVYTTIKSYDQNVAYEAVRSAVIKYTLQSEYNGPESQIIYPQDNIVSKDNLLIEKNIIEALENYSDDKDIMACMIIAIDENSIKLVNRKKEIITLDDKKSISLTKNIDDNKKIKIGSIVYLYKKNNHKQIINAPSVQAAFVSTSPKSGAIISLIGGFDFRKGNFNRVTHAWRQPGSSIKPFIYAASIEKGISTATKISDMPITLTAEQTGSKTWNPKNYGHRYEDTLTMRQGLYKSKNMISIRILDYIGISYAQDYLTKFGFEKDKQPAVLSLALGTGLVTPIQLTTAFATFANGGHLIQPYLIEKVVDNNGQIIMQHSVVDLDETNQKIDPRTVYIMNDLLKGVVTHGTASRIHKILNRSDIAGKTGTTNDSVDAWFTGYTPEIVATAWLGFDLPKSLGTNETGGRLAMPIWIDYMSKILKKIPEYNRDKIPEGIIIDKNELYIREFPPGKAITELK